jgi:hypothetical protein
MSIRASAVSLSADDSEIPSDTGLCNYRIKVIFVKIHWSPCKWRLLLPSNVPGSRGLAYVIRVFTISCTTAVCLGFPFIPQQRLLTGSIRNSRNIALIGPFMLKQSQLAELQQFFQLTWYIGAQHPPVLRPWMQLPHVGTSIRS